MKVKIETALIYHKNMICNFLSKYDRKKIVVTKWNKKVLFVVSSGSKCFISRLVVAVLFCCLIFKTVLYADERRTNSIDDVNDLKA